MKVNRKIALLSALTLPAAGLFAAAPANAAQSIQEVDCQGLQVIVRTNNNNSSDHGGWGAAQVVNFKGHLIPTSFNGSLYDETTQSEIFSFSQDKGNGNANQNQPTINCIVDQEGTLADFLGPGDVPPPNTSPSDIVEFTIYVTGVPK
jgi:hypothetical protein